MRELSHDSLSIDGCDTMVKLFRHRVKTLGAKVAMREKKFGIWESFTWTQYGEKAREIAMGLTSLGLKRGDVCAVISDNNKEWLFTDMGIQTCGGITTGIYTTDASKQVEYILNDSSTKYLFVENEEQLDKYLEVRESVSQITKVIVYDPEGLHDFKDEKVIMIEELYELGRSYSKDHEGLWDEIIESIKADDLMVLVYTSGTTGPPKGAMLTHRNSICGLLAINEMLPTNENDEQLSFLPLCHVAERLFSIHLPMKTCGTINFVEQQDTVPENIREVSPTLFFAVPRIWEKFYSTISIQVKDATRFGRWAYKRAISIGYRAAEYRLSGEKIPFALGMIYRLAKATVLNNIKRMLGLNRVNFTLSGAAPISPDLIKWYYALGIDMIEGYGQTECTGFATCNRIGQAKLGTIGKPISGVEVKLSEKGEILIKGSNVFVGYLNQPEKTAETIVEGWLHTGDVGKVDKDGYFTITDRMKDIIITAGGKNITPSEFENQLKFSPYITDAVIIGDKRKYLSCLIMIDQENVEKYAQDNDVPYTNYASLCRTQEVIQLIWDEVANINKDFARVEQVKKFRLIDQLLTAEDDELTPTMKLKRKFVNEKYKDLINSMYQ